MKKVLIITYYWPPAGGSGVQRWVKFAKYLRDFGWEPVIFTVESTDYPIIDNSIGLDLPDGIEVIKSKIVEPYQLYNFFSGKKKGQKIDANFLSEGKKLNWKDKIAVWIRGNIFIPDAKFLWIGPSVRYLLNYLKENHINAVISTGPPHSCHLIAQKVCKKTNIPWIVDYRDPWTQIDYFDELMLTSWAKKRHIKLEKKVLDDCSHIITVGNSMADDIRKQTDTKVTVITNGYDEADRNINIINPRSDKFVLSYLGVMNVSRDPEVLWQTLKKLKLTQNEVYNKIEINLIGQVEEYSQKNIVKYGLEEKVKLFGYLAHKDAIVYQNSSDALLLVINKTKNNKTILTGKIFEYIASGKPIICIGPKNGDAAAILSSLDNTYIIDYQNTEEMEKAIISLINNRLTTAIFSKNVEQYSRKTLTSKLADVLNGL
ncbi:MAG: glycosyltransferase family 4 protein [Saprospiraceae bacterium]|nr:glycosyltransferase family 4 protein [Saprospiraceae bacterium]